MKKNRLSLRKETVANLNNNQMKSINGGINTINIDSTPLLCQTGESICSPCIPATEDGCMTSEACSPTHIECLIETIIK
ncbi:MAG: class I lanthipeptide [Hyphomicrobiales bacterium]